MTTVATAHRAPREVPSGDPSVPRLELEEWRTRFGVTAGITTREHGFSLGLWSDESVGRVMERWRLFRAAFQPTVRAFVSSHQVHGTTVSWHEARRDGWLIQDECDGHATACPELLLTVTVADCVPVYLVAPDHGAIALLHAGWRGVAGGMLRAGLDLLARRGGVSASHVVMHCGVAICGSCYAVGPDVAARLGVASRHVDLRSVLALQAEQCGVREISVSPWCSAHDRDRFFSHRASAGRDGRMVAYLART